MVNFINSFYGGMSQDDSLMWKGQYVYSDWFDISRYPSQIKPMCDLSYVSSNLFTSEIRWFFGADVWQEWLGTADGKIYRIDGTLIDDLWFTSAVYAWIYFHNYFYVFTTDRVIRYTYAAGSLTWQATVRTLTQPSARPVIYAGSIMFYAGWLTSSNNVTYIDNTDVAYDLFTVDLSTQVTGVSIQGNYLRVYTLDSIVIVDIGSKTVSYTIKIPFQPTWVTSTTNIDYVTSPAWELFVCSGLDYKQIAEKTYSDILYAAWINAWVKYDFNDSYSQNSITYSNDRLYVIDNNSTYVVYGSMNEWTQKSLFYWLVNSSLATFDEVTALYASWNSLYIAWRDWTNYRAWVIDHNNYSNIAASRCSQATIITPALDFWDYSIQKALDEIRVWMEGQGTLWASFDGGAFVKIGTLNQTELYQKIMGYKKNFRDVALMVKLTNNTYASRLSNIDIRFTNFNI